MSQTVEVALGSRSYPIHIGPGLIDRAGALLAPYARGVVPVVTDENVARLHLPRLLGSLRADNIDARAVVLPPGEQTKSFATFEGLCRELIRLRVERSGLIVAFGGGVIGDVAGLAAALVKRGVGREESDRSFSSAASRHGRHGTRFDFATARTACRLR
jgi:3-dehydroquinate synthase